MVIWPQSCSVCLYICVPKPKTLFHYQPPDGGITHYLDAKQYENKVRRKDQRERDNPETQIQPTKICLFVIILYNIFERKNG